MATKARQRSKALSKPAPRLASYRVAKRGPLSVQVHGEPDQIFPRPPPACGACGTRMVHAFSMSGDLGTTRGKSSGKGSEQVLGKARRIHVYGCPLEAGGCGEFREVRYATAGPRSPVDRYYRDELGRLFFHAHVSEQHDWEGSRTSLTIHRGQLGTPGMLESTPVKSVADAWARAAKRLEVAEHRYEEVTPEKLGKVDREAVREQHRVHHLDFRSKYVDKGKHLGATSLDAKRFALEPFLDARDVTLGELDGPSPVFLSRESIVGGTPSWIQSPEDPSCKKCKKPMTFIAQAEQASILHSPAFQYGDLGSLYFFVCAQCRAPFGVTCFQCH